ncbi:MAG: bacteriochlorophyll 4-vinyl reductase [Candidatus Baltobacteraceae bacterium]
MTSPALTGRIGPNAIVRTVEALRDRLGESPTEALLEAAGLSVYFREPPQAMVPEAEVTALFRTLFLRLEEAEAKAVARDAGRRTAEYLLANRIPGFAQTVLRLLPPRLACRGLLASIGRHTWTFAGSGTVRLVPNRPARIAIENCPLCRGLQTSRPACDFYAGTFERLFQALVKSGASAEETACRGLGRDDCLFAVDY